MFLTPDELIDLTEAKQPAKQIKVLNALGYKFDILPSGRVKMLRQQILERQLSEKPVCTPGPDYSSLDEAS